MDDAFLLNLWQRPESELIEWKPSLSQTDSIYRTICAFANDYSNHQQQGVIFVGREDNGNCSYTTIADGDMRDFIEHIRSSGSILPLPEVSYQQVVIDGCPVLALIVKPSASTPVQYGQTIWIRQGPSTRRATPHETVVLTEKRKNSTFDARAANGAVFEDLDHFYLQEEYIPNAVSREVINENNRSLKEQLAALRILTPQFEPTNLGILVAGKDPLRFLPGAYVQFLRVDGLELSDPIKDSLAISGRVSHVLRLTFDKLLAHIEIASAIDNTGKRIEHPTYPFPALRELVANAVVHRNYETSNAPIRITWFDDRIEIHNPGGPYGLVTDTNFGEPYVTDYRNPELAAALKYLGYVERFGWGIAQVRRQLKLNNNPDVRFEPRKHENYVLAIVRSRIRT
jgi:ATP-dependent DNA helicase RecG